MSHSTASYSLLSLARNSRRLNISDPLMQCLVPRLNRNFATTVDLHPSEVSSPSAVNPIQTPANSPMSDEGRVLTTLYSWPDLEPQQFKWYSSQHLGLPLRKDILHRAVIYEGDVKRGWSTASTKWRKDVHGSNRKIAPQKGLGRARVGDKKSPIRRGGGVAFGPHPRDFATELPKKIYDIAWRTALSYRYQKGELIVLNDQMTLPLDSSPRLLENIFLQNRWDSSHERSLLVSDLVYKGGDVSSEETMLAKMRRRLFQNMKEIGEHGSIKDSDEVEVRDLLQTGRVIIDQQTLDKLIILHSSDLSSHVKRVC